MSPGPGGRHVWGGGVRLWFSDNCGAEAVSADKELLRLLLKIQRTGNGEGRGDLAIKAVLLLILRGCVDQGNVSKEF